MLSKKSQVSTDTPIILTMFVFSGICLLFLGYANLSTYAESSQPEAANIITSYVLASDTSNSCDCGVLTCAEYKGIYGHLPGSCVEVTEEQSQKGVIFPSLITNIKLFPFLATVLFIPLLLTLAYIIIKLIRGGG